MQIFVRCAIDRPSSIRPIKKPEPKAEKLDARIEGAKQIAIGIKKEVDFAGWYTNVPILSSVAFPHFCLLKMCFIGINQSGYDRLLQC
jgi:hypothetical protein